MRIRCSFCSVSRITLSTRRRGVVSILGDEALRARALLLLLLLLSALHAPWPSSFDVYDEARRDRGTT